MNHVSNDIIYTYGHDIESLAIRYLFMGANIYRYFRQNDLSGLPDLSHRHVFQWMIRPGITVINVSEPWLPEMGVLISDMAAEDRIRIEIDPTDEQLRNLLTQGEHLAPSILPDLSAQRAQLMEEARVVVPMCGPLEKRTASPIVVFTPDAECVADYPFMKSWLSCQFHMLQRLKDLGIRVVILSDDPATNENAQINFGATRVGGIPFPVMDCHLAVGGMRLDDWAFRKVMQTVFGMFVPDDFRHGLPIEVYPEWLREHVNQLYQAQPRM